jgi:hypothetical protein
MDKIVEDVVCRKIGHQFRIVHDQEAVVMPYYNIYCDRCGRVEAYRRTEPVNQ